MATPVESWPYSSGKSASLQRKVCIYNLIIVDHGNGYWTYYALNSQLLVQAGDGVTQGQTISLAGSTGNSTGPHLDFRIRLNGGAFLNPLTLLP